MLFVAPEKSIKYSTHSVIAADSFLGPEERIDAIKTDIHDEFDCLVSNL